MPSPPARFEPKTIVKASRDSDARVSFAALWMGAPRLVGVNQSSAVVSRIAVQMSCPPEPPGRLYFPFSYECFLPFVR